MMLECGVRHRVSRPGNVECLNPQNFDKLKYPRVQIFCTILSRNVSTRTDRLICPSFSETGIKLEFGYGSEGEQD